MGTRAQRLRCAAFTWELAGRRLIVLEEYKYLGAESGKASGAAGRWNSLLGRLLTRAKLALSDMGLPSVDSVRQIASRVDLQETY